MIPMPSPPMGTKSTTGSLASASNVGFLGNPKTARPTCDVVSRWALDFPLRIDHEPWDGTQDGKPVPMGIYAVHPLDGSGRWRNESLHLSVFPER